MRILCLLAGLALAGCAAPYTWEHPGLDPATAERQGEIDRAECMALAMQQVQLPSEPAQTNVNVNVSGFGPTMTRTSSDLAAQQAETIRTGAFVQAQDERDALANACLLRRGWVRVRRGEQASVASAPLPASSPALAAAEQPTSEPVPAPAVQSQGQFQQFDDWRSKISGSAPQ